jgi:hypothetical protein
VDLALSRIHPDTFGGRGEAGSPDMARCAQRHNRRQQGQTARDQITHLITAQARQHVGTEFPPPSTSARCAIPAALSTALPATSTTTVTSANPNPAFSAGGPTPQAVSAGVGLTVDVNGYKLAGLVAHGSVDALAE